MDAAALEQALRRHMRGDVPFRCRQPRPLRHDGSNYRQVPDGCRSSSDADDVIAAVSLARIRRPSTCRDSGPPSPDSPATWRWSSTLPATWAISWKSTPQRRTTRVQPGVVLDHLRNAAEKHHLTFGLTRPATTAAPSEA